MAEIRTSYITTEHGEQVALFLWAQMNKARLPWLDMMFAIPNGGERNVIVASRMKEEGVKKGVPDIFIPCPAGGYHGMFIEMKRSGGRVSPEQAAMIKKLQNAGYCVAVCYGWEEAVQQIELYAEVWECVE